MVYQQLSAKAQTDVEQIKCALFELFAMDSFKAYKWFTMWCLLEDEMTDVYLAVMHAISYLGAFWSDLLCAHSWLDCQFILSSSFAHFPV